MPRNPHKPATNRTALIILSLLALSIFGALFLNWGGLINLVSRDPAQEGQKELQNQIVRLEQELEELAEHQTTTPATPPPAPSEAASLASIDYRQKTCRELDALIQEYFSQLDQQPFMARYALKGGSHDRFSQMVDSLQANPPIVARETDSLFTILTNTAHFYRILGKDNILMLKDILLHTGESLEEDLALFYQWSIAGKKCPDSMTRIDLSLQGLYEYAGFFLNTLGGQAYLFRRESRQRLLIKYYCVLILDRANAQILNRHGIDLVPHLESLTREVEAVETLVYKEHYLRTLRDLQIKYQAYYQVGDAGQPASPAR